MNIINKAKEIKYLEKKLEYYLCILKGIKNHSFGFGTSYYKLDDFLKPLTELWVKNEIVKLKEELSKKIK